jgi:hypothetical protein
MAPSQALLRTHLVFHPALCKWIVEIGRKVSQLLDGSLSMFLRDTIIFFMHVESWKEQWHLCATEIIDLIYAQCVTYIASEEGKTLDHDVWTGGKNPPREGVAHYPMWAGLYIRRRQPNFLYTLKPNTT